MAKPEPEPKSSTRTLVIALLVILGVVFLGCPCLIFSVKVGWPRIKDYFNKELDDLEPGNESLKLPSLAVAPFDERQAV